MQVDVRGQLTLDEASLARIAVLEHAGIGFFLEQDVIDDIQAGRLIRLLDDWTPLFPACVCIIPVDATLRRAGRVSGAGAGICPVRQPLSEPFASARIML